MNKIFSDYVACLRKRMIIDMVGPTDAANAIATANWALLTKTGSRTIIRDNPPLREALIANGLPDHTLDREFRAYLKEQDNRNV